MPIRLAFYLFSVAIVLLIVMTGAYRSGAKVVASLFCVAGTEVLLLSFMLLLLFGAYACCHKFYRQLAYYLSGYAIEQRRFWFVLLRQEQYKSLYANRIKQQHYISAHKRKRLLRANNLKHAKLALSSIRKDVDQMDKRLDLNAYKQLHAQFKHRSLNLQDVDDLLKFQQQLFAFVNQK